jgi:hypothetical protein
MEIHSPVQNAAWGIFLCDNLKKYCTYDEFLRTCGFPLLL